MSIERELVAIEARLWKNDAELYYDALTDETSGYFRRRFYCFTHVGRRSRVTSATRDRTMSP